MKNFKRVLSLALAALMVIGGLVVAPVDAKADATYTKISSVSELTAGTKFVIVAECKGSYYVGGTTETKGYKAVTTTLDNLTSAPVLEIEASATAGKVNIKSGAGYFKAPSSNALNFDNSGKGSDWEIIDAGNGEVKIFDSATSRYVTFNYNNGSPLIRCYADKSSDTSGNYDMTFIVYKVEGAESGSEGGNDTPTDITLPADATPDQIIEAAYKAKDDGVALLGTWTLTGVIQSITDAYTGGSDYKNVDVTIKVGDNEKLMRCYRVVNGTNVTLDDLQGLGVGDTITVTGTISYYGSSVQYIAGSTIDKVEKAAVVIPDIELPADATPEQIINAAYQAKEDGVHLLGTWTLTGVITTITDAYTGDSDYKNVDVTIKVGDIEKVMRCYRVVNGTDVTLEDLQGLAEGDTITVTGTITWYGDSVQFAQGSTIDSIVKATVDDPNGSEDDSTTGSEDDSTTGSEDDDEMTAEEILAEAAKLEDGQYLGGSKDVKYTLKGVITEYEFNEQYGDASITIKVDGTDETFYCYQVKGEDVKNLKVGDHIELNGAIKNYKGTIEFERPNLVAILPTGDFSSVGTVMILIAGVACLAVAFTSKKKMA